MTIVGTSARHTVVAAPKAKVVGTLEEVVVDGVVEVVVVVLVGDDVVVVVDEEVVVVVVVDVEPPGLHAGSVG